MNRTAKFVLALAVMISICWAVVGSTDRGELMAGPPDPPPALPIPTDLYNLDISLDTTAVYTDRKRAWFGWDTTGQRIRIKRAFRSSSSAPWQSQEDEISSSFLLTSVAAVCDGTSKSLDTFFVAGTYEATGLSTIEKWIVTYGSGITATIVQRVVLFQGSNLGFIRSIAVDDDRQRMFVLTHDNEVYRLGSLAGALAAPVKVHDAVSLPTLADAKGLQYGKHAVEGPKWIVSVSGSYHAILLNDPDDDGLIDSTASLTSSQWKSGGYQSEDAWDDPCID